MDEDLKFSEIGDEDFFEQAETWRPDQHADTRLKAAEAMKKVNKKRGRPSKSNEIANVSKKAGRKKK